MSVRSRVTDIRNRFEGVPVSAPRERFVSAVDAPAAAVSEEGRIASMKSAEKTEAAAGGAPARRRRVPAIVPGDSGELRTLKKQAADKEKEIQALAGRITALNERLGRVTSLLDASAFAPVIANATDSGNRIRSTEFQTGTAQAKKLIDSSRGGGGIPSAAKKKPAGASNSLESILAAARSAPKAKPPAANGASNSTQSNDTASPADNSLEAILAAARGGSKAAGGAKFSKMIRDMK